MSLSALMSGSHWPPPSAPLAIVEAQGNFPEFPVFIISDSTRMYSESECDFFFVCSLKWLREKMMSGEFDSHSARGCLEVTCRPARLRSQEAPLSLSLSLSHSYTAAAAAAARPQMKARRSPLFCGTSGCLLGFCAPPVSRPRRAASPTSSTFFRSSRFRLN